MDVVLETLDAPAVRRWSLAAAAALAAHQDEIDDLNVYPVPDGDTGTNLALTMRAAADALGAHTTDTALGALREMAHGAVLGARGNAGVIVSQILRGLADGIAEPDAGGTADVDGCDGNRLRRGLQVAASHAYAAVARPVEGTILSVARAAADAARGVPPSATLPSVVTAALAGAAEALRHTPEQLPVLARAGVVDAGGRGLVVLLGALASIVTGVEEPAGRPPRVVRCRDALQAMRESGSAEFGYEVQYLLHANEELVALLRAELAAIGDSVVVAGTGDGLWSVHVHVDDVGAAIEAGVEAGRTRRITVVRFADQIAADAIEVRPSRTGVAVVAVAPGDGLAHLFSGEGVRVVEAGAGVDPSQAKVLDAVLATGAAQVILLPNATQTSDVADAAADEARAVGVEVAVVPTHSPVQGLAAVAVHDASRHFHQDVIAMAEAAAATRWAEITVAQREALTSVGRCQPGDVLGLIVGEVVEIGKDVESVTRAVLDRLLAAGGELITIVTGAEADAAGVEALKAYLTAAQPLVEVAVFDGGQPNFPLLIGVE